MNFGLVKDEYISFYAGTKKSSDVFEEEKNVFLFHYKLFHFLYESCYLFGIKRNKFEIYFQ